MIDLHCHILPDLDDGPESIEESLVMARRAFSDGIRTIVATPHTLNGTYLNTPSKTLQYVDNLNLALSQNEASLTILPGADVHICPGMAEKVLKGEAFTINGTGRYVLVEFPYQTIPDGSQDELFKLKVNGITPIITHPERNFELLGNMELIYSFIETGSLIQVTAMSVTGDFGHEAMEYSHKLLELRLVHIIATDAHSADRRPPVLSEAVEVAATVLKSEHEAMEMVEDRPRAIINGESVDVPTPVKGKRKWWRF